MLDPYTSLLYASSPSFFSVTYHIIYNIRNKSIDDLVLHLYSGPIVTLLNEVLQLVVPLGVLVVSQQPQHQPLQYRALPTTIHPCHEVNIFVWLPDIKIIISDLVNIKL